MLAADGRRASGVGDADRARHGDPRARQRATPRRGVHRALAQLSADGHVGTGVYTFGVGVERPAADGGRRRLGHDLARRRRPLGALRLALAPAGRRRDQAARPPARRRSARRATRPPARDRRRGARAQRRHRRLRDALRQRAPGLGRRPALCRSLAVRGVDAVRHRLPRDDARLRGLPDDPRRLVGTRPPRAPLARLPARRRARLGISALGTPGDRAERVASSGRSPTGYISSPRCCGSAAC